MAVTIKDVAREAGVVPSTVSKVLWGTGSISEPTRQRVQEAMERLGYQPNASARSLVTGQTETIGIVINRAAQLAFANPFFPEVMGGVGEVAEARGFSVLVRTGADRAEEKARTLELVRTRRVTGLIVPSSRAGDSLLRELAEYGYPFVLIGRPDFTEPDIPWVNTDNVQDAYRGTQLLIGRGHRSIAMLTGSSRLIVSQDRQEGYRRAVAEVGLAPQIVEAGSTVSEAADALGAWLDGGGRPTAVFCSDDLRAVGAYKALSARGLAIPKDVAVLAFNDFPTAELLNPPLSCIRVPYAELSRRAAAMLLSIVHHEPVEERHVVLPTELVLRGSC